MKYVVHVRPAEDFENYMLNWKRRLAEHVEGESGLGPHCTLLSSRFRESDEPRITQSLGSIVRGQFPAQLTGEIALFDGLSLVARMERSLYLQELHQDVIQKLRPFTDWNETPALNEHYAKDARRAAVYKAYGSPYCAEFYHPHVTLAQAKASILGKAEIIAKTKVPRYGWSVLEFQLDKKKDGKWCHVQRFLLHP